MRRTSRSSVRSLATLLAAGSLLLVAVAVPVAGSDHRADPGASGKPGEGPRTEKAAKPGKPAKAERQAKVPAAPVTLTGRVGTRAAGDGDPEYTLTVGGTVHVLDAGPAWWWGEDHPLAGRVGDTVTITGEQAEGSAEVDVLAIDGTALRAAGRPAWAGGWKAVGERHPGWAAWKIEKLEARGEHRGGSPSWAGPKAGDAEG